MKSATTRARRVQLRAGANLLETTRSTNLMDFKSLCPRCKRIIVYGTICFSCLGSLGHATNLEHTEQQRAPQRVYQTQATVVSSSSATSTVISQLPLADAKTLVWRPPGSS